MAVTPPTLGYGQRAEAPIDAVNQWMRTQPWYQSLIRSFGQDPSNVHLTDNQKQQVIRAAQANGIVVDEGHNGQEVDDSGNFQPKSHTLRNTLIVAGIAAAALATAGAAGAFGGAALPAASGVEGLSATSLGLPVTAGLGTAGATTAAVTAGAGAAWDAAGNFVGPTTISSVAPKVSDAISSGITGTDLLRYGLPTAASIASGIIQANASGKASADQQKYLEEALAYEKQQDALKQQNLETARATEGGRYGAFSANIAPFIASGQGANSRMASLLGITPAMAPPASLSRYAPSPSSPMQTTQQQNLPKSPDQNQIGAQPVQLVTLEAPDGSQKQVPADQVPRFLQIKDAQGRSPRVLGAAA